MKNNKIASYDLNKAVEFDSPFRVFVDGGVATSLRDIYAPNVLDEEIDDNGWEFVDGYSGQDCYSGPIMHNSEYLGGRMADDVLATPGIYVVVIAYWSPEKDDDQDEGTIIEGWALLKLKED